MTRSIHSLIVVLVTMLSSCAGNEPSTTEVERAPAMGAGGVNSGPGQPRGAGRRARDAPVPQCSAQAQCEAGESCIDAQCEPAGTAPRLDAPSGPMPLCISSAQCGEQGACVNAQCLWPQAQNGSEDTSAPCVFNGECGEAARCIDAHCVLDSPPTPSNAVACWSFLDCAGDQQCVDGACAPRSGGGRCGNCPAPRYCAGGRGCLACQWDAQCADGLRCVNHLCLGPAEPTPAEVFPCPRRTEDGACASAIPYTVGQWIQGNTQGDGSCAFRGSCTEGPEALEKIYTFVAGRRGPVCFTTRGTAFETALYVRQDHCIRGPHPEVCGTMGQSAGCCVLDDGDGEASLREPGDTRLGFSTLHFEMVEGTRYYVIVDGRTPDQAGPFSFSSRRGWCDPQAPPLSMNPQPQ